MSKTICCVVGCSNSHAKALKNNIKLVFYRFPSKDRFPGRSDKWIAAVNRRNPDGTNWRPSTNSRICSEHFVGGKKRDEMLHPAYIPTIMPAVYHRRSADAGQAESRFQRTQNRKRRLGVKLLQTDEPKSMKECSMENQVETSKNVIGKQSLEEKRQKCRERVARFRAKMSDEMKAAKREKDREYKQKLKDQGVIKGIKELPSSDQCNKKKQWRKYSSNYRKRNSQVKETEVDTVRDNLGSKEETSDCFDSSLLEPEVVIKVEPIDNYEDPTPSSSNHEFILPCTDLYHPSFAPVIKEAFTVVATEPIEVSQPITSNFRTPKPTKSQTSDVVKQINTNGWTMKSNYRTTEPIEVSQPITSNFRTTKPTKNQTSDIVKQINTNDWTMKSNYRTTEPIEVSQPITSNCWTTKPTGNQTSDIVKQMNTNGITMKSILKQNAAKVVKQTENTSHQENAETSKTTSPKDPFDVYGEYIAAKLRNLDLKSCTYVQKAFADILFDAEMGKFK